MDKRVGKNAWQRTYKGHTVIVYFTRDGWTCDFESYHPAPKIAVARCVKTYEGV